MWVLKFTERQRGKCAQFWNFYAEQSKQMLFLLDAVNIEFQLQQRQSTILHLQAAILLQHFTTQIHSNRFSSNTHSLEFVAVVISSVHVILHWFYCDASFLLPFVNTRNCAVSFFYWKLRCILCVFYLRLCESRQYRIIYTAKRVAFGVICHSLLLHPFCINLKYVCLSILAYIFAFLYGILTIIVISTMKTMKMYEKFGVQYISQHISNNTQRAQNPNSLRILLKWKSGFFPTHKLLLLFYFYCDPFEFIVILFKHISLSNFILEKYV